MSATLAECAGAQADGFVCDASPDGHTTICVDGKITYPAVIVGAATQFVYRMQIAARPDETQEHYKSLVREFYRLAAVWKAERGHSSKLAELIRHPAYQQIIRLGQRAIPLLLEEMKARPDHWDFALRAITGIDPVPQSAWGKLRQVSAAWIAWGRERGYISDD